MTVQASVTITWAAKTPPWETERNIIQADFDQIEAKVAEWLPTRVQTLAEREANRQPSSSSRTAQNRYRQSRTSAPPRNWRGD